jgi:hypothetical protein
MIAETSNDPKHPSRFEKKRNIGAGCPGGPPRNVGYGTR